jgi:hypothetical protein
MTKEEALAFDLALEALEKLRTPLRVNTALDAYDVGRAITAIKQVRALDKKAENARELGLDYGPVAWSDTKQSELNDWFLSLPTERQAVLLEDKWMLAGAAFLAGKTTPPAQPAHLAQVVRAHIQDLRACLPTLREHKLSDTAAEVEKAANELEAAAAQPAPVPSTLPDFSPIFDGITKGGAA